MSNARELAELGGSYGTGGFVGMKNRIINGAMMIDQRNAGTSLSVSTDAGIFSVDRWKVGANGGGVFTAEQVEEAPSGFYQSLKITVTTADSSLAATDYYNLQQRIEGYNVSDFLLGTANAATFTISFWVRSSLTGTFGAALYNNAANRSYPFTYTISAANTWEQKSITVAGDTSGTWTKDNSAGLTLNLSLGAGSTYTDQAAGSWVGSLEFGASGQTNLISTNGATFYITGVQLEKGSTATSFDYRPYGTELALCQRYYEFESSGTNYRPLCWLQGSTPVTQSISVWFAVEKRANPTVTGTISSYVGGSTSGGTFGNITTRAFHALQSGTAAAPALNGWSATAEL